jgi:hypothetical protein
MWLGSNLQVFEQFKNVSNSHPSLNSELCLNNFYGLNSYLTEMTNRLILFKETFSIYYENHMEHIGTLRK